MAFNEVGLFRGDDYHLNQYITLRHPTLEQIFDYGEQEYWSIAQLICATPSDLKHQLWDGYKFYFDKVDEFDLFCMLAGSFAKEKINIIFNGLDFSTLYIRDNQNTGMKEIFDKDSGMVIDKVIYTLIVDYIRKINGLKKNCEVPGNDGTRTWMIDDSRNQSKLYQEKPFNSIILPMMSTLVNCEGFKYNHFTVGKLPIYSFLDSAKQILHIKNVGYLTSAVYSGNIDMKSINKKELDLFGGA